MITDYAGFRAGYDAGHGQMLWTRSVADLETPVAAYLKLGDGKPNSFLLESVEGGAARGRYSIIGLDPDLLWRCRDGAAELNRDVRAAPYAFVPEGSPPLDSLRALLHQDGALEPLNRLLCDAIAQGRVDLSTPGLADHLWATTLAKIAIDQPTYPSYLALVSK